MIPLSFWERKIPNGKNKKRESNGTVPPQFHGLDMREYIYVGETDDEDSDNETVVFSPHDNTYALCSVLTHRWFEHPTRKMIDRITGVPTRTYDLEQWRKAHPNRLCKLSSRYLTSHPSSWEHVCPSTADARHLSPMPCCFNLQCEMVNGLNTCIVRGKIPYDWGHQVDFVSDDAARGFHKRAPTFTKAEDEVKHNRLATNLNNFLHQGNNSLFGYILTFLPWNIRSLLSISFCNGTQERQPVLVKAEIACSSGSPEIFMTTGLASIMSRGGASENKDLNVGSDQLRCIVSSKKHCDLNRRMEADLLHYDLVNVCSMHGLFCDWMKQIHDLVKARYTEVLLENLGSQKQEMREYVVADGGLRGILDLAKHEIAHTLYLQMWLDIGRYAFHPEDLFLKLLQDFFGHTPNFAPKNALLYGTSGADIHSLHPFARVQRIAPVLIKALANARLCGPTAKQEFNPLEKTGDFLFDCGVHNCRVQHDQKAKIEAAYDTASQFAKWDGAGPSARRGLAKTVVITIIPDP
jgi:hypothetical protein